jgi:hypothetical protein
MYVGRLLASKIFSKDMRRDVSNDKRYNHINCLYYPLP